MTHCVAQSACGVAELIVNIYIAVLLPDLCNALLRNNRIYLSSFLILQIAAVCHIRLSKIKTLILRQVLGSGE